MSVHYPVFIEDEYPLEALYCRQYKAVKNKEASGNTLSSDERDFLKEVVPILKKRIKLTSNPTTVDVSMLKSTTSGISITILE